MYHTKNPRAPHSYPKGHLVMWRSKQKAWATAALSEEWFINHFILAIENIFPFQTRLILTSLVIQIHCWCKPLHRHTILLPNMSFMWPLDLGVNELFSGPLPRCALAQVM
jgi:hypothetical protein